jgi:hypothetical protein
MPDEPKIEEKPVDKETAKPTATPVENNLNYMDDLEYHQVADWMGIGYEERKDPKLAEKLSFLYDWAKEKTGSSDRIDRLEAIRAIQKQMGVNNLSKDTIKKMYMYVRLDKQRQKVEQEMKTLSEVDSLPIK